LYQQLRSDYSDQPLLIEYLHNYKYPTRQQWAKAWTSHITHFGNCATSRLEGGHHHLKTWLTTNQGDLMELKDKLTAIHNVAQAKYRTEAATKRDRPAHQYHAKRWPKLLDQDLNYHISPPAMKLLAEQLFIIADQVAVVRPCTGCFEKIHQIPCHHTLRAYARYKRIVTKEDFHQHWHYKLDLPPPPPQPLAPSIFAPHVVHTRGRPREDHSTRRNPSQFEQGEPTTQRRRPGRVGGETFIVCRLQASSAYTSC
jgi:hypothetical protein